MCTRYPIINRVSELKVHIELTRFVQPEKIEIAANERAVNEKSQYCFFVCTTFDSFLNDLQGTIPCPLHHNYYVFASTNLNWDFIYSKGFNNCYILLSNISQSLENTKFIAGELSLIVSLALYRPTSVYELW